VKEAFEVASAVLVALGGGAAIVFAFSSWLGKVWANRILEQERVKYSQQLEELKQRLELQLHSGKALFDAEFGIYRELWTHANDLRLLAVNIRSGLRKSLLTEEEHIERYKQFSVQLSEIEHFVNSYKPFFSVEIHSALALLILHAGIENKRAMAHRDLEGMDLGRDHMEGVVPVLEAWEELCRLIRNRLFGELIPNPLGKKD
jgi:hypothetical protein